MSDYDVFNGDADGLCALHQLRLAKPRAAALVTGVKRDVALLSRVDARSGDRVTVLDIAVDANREALRALLERGVRVDWFDHHYAGALPEHPLLRATIDASPGVCTGMLVDRFLGGAHRPWAVVAAFGDNLFAAAHALAGSLSLDDPQLAMLRALGEALAYNGYGDREADLIVHPARLYEIVHRYADPFEFVRAEPVFATIDRRRQEDLELARLLLPELATPGATVYILPDEAWSRRARGAFANELARLHPDLAHAVLTPDGRGGYTVSVRAPAVRGVGADALCRKFATGGGRAAAAGINHLPRESLPAFVRELDRAFP
jgi:hypothetical protein